MQHMRRPSSGGGATGDAADAAAPGKVLGKLLAVWEFLTETEWGEGEPRRTGTVLLFVEDGRVKVCANDRDSDSVCFVSGSTPDEALGSLDQGLRDGDLDWRPSSRRKGSKQK